MSRARHVTLKSGLAFSLFLSACGGDADTREVRAPSSWLAPCTSDAGCGPGQCLCGICTRSCASSGCGDGPPGSECIQTNHFAHAGLCAGRVTEPICLATCSDTAPCGSEQACVEGVCLSAATAGVIDAAQNDSAAPSLCSANPVVLRSLRITDQAQLDALVGCERIEGDLALELFPGARLGSLASLQAVTGVLAVIGNPSGRAEPVPVFDSLELVGGLSLASVRMDGPPGFPKLKAIRAGSPFDVRRGGLSIFRCDGLSDLAAFADIEELAFLSVNATATITSFRGMTGLRRLRRLEVEGGDIARLDGLQQALGLQNLQLRHTAIETLDALGEQGELEVISLDDNDRLTSLAGLGLPESLRVLDITNHDRLQTLHGLQGLRLVDSLDIAGNAILASTSGLDGLEQVGTFLLTNNPRLSSLDGLGALRDVSDFRMVGNPALVGLDGLARLESVGALLLENDAALQSLVGLATTSLETIEVRSTGLPDLEGLEQAIGLRYVLLEDNPSLTSLAGFPVPIATAYIAVRRSPLLADLAGLSRVTSSSSLELEGLGMSDLDALQGWGELGVLRIAGNANLVQTDALSDVRGLSELSVRDNPRLERLPEFAGVLDLNSPEHGPFEAEIVRNAVLVDGPGFPALTGAATITVMDNPSLARLTGFSALSVVDALMIQNNPALTELDLSSLERAQTLVIRGQGALNEQALASLDDVAVEGQRKIASGSGRSPCPWLGDSFCDEQFSECAPGSDVLDCAGIDALTPEELP